MKNFVIPALTFIGGCSIGVYAGVKGFAAFYKSYIYSDEFKAYLDEMIDPLIDEMIEKIKKEDQG